MEQPFYIHFLATIIIVSYNTKDVLRECLDSVRHAIVGLRVKVVVVDNASHDGSADMVQAEFPQYDLIRSTVNLGFAAANNLAFKHADSRYIVLLNPDAILNVDTLQRAIQLMNRQILVGLAGGRLLDKDGKDQPSGRLFPSLLNEFLVLSGLAARYPRSRFFGRFDRTWADPQQSAEVDWVPGAFTILRSQILSQTGGFDERFFLYYEEVDLCRRIKALGWHVAYWPELVIQHIGGASSKTVTNQTFTSSGSQLVLWRMRSALLYYRKHHGQLGCFLAAQLEICWHNLRRYRAQHRGEQAKVAESLDLVKLMHQAWQDTQGGTICPERPW